MRTIRRQFDAAMLQALDKGQGSKPAASETWKPGEKKQTKTEGGKNTTTKIHQQKQYDKCSSRSLLQFDQFEPQDASMNRMLKT